MKNIFDTRPEKRDFKYKPRYYDPDGTTKDENGDFDVNKFADRIHRKWSNKRQKKKSNTSLLTLIILMCFVLIVLFFVYKLIIL